ncbi:MAG: WG repeat-containing protein [Thermoanaerobaculia bacterium]|nr:WG repeat-containing protein [Thermoanaerobaculia bacterium]
MRIPVKTEAGWGYVDEAGVEVIAPQYQAAGAFAEGVAGVLIDGNVAFIDEAGEEVIPPTFAPASRYGDILWKRPFVGGHVALKSEGRVGCINRAGAITVPFVYEYVGTFVDDRAVVRSKVGDETAYSVLNTEGDVTVPPGYDMLGNQYWDGRLRAQRKHEGQRQLGGGSLQDWRWGFLDRDGNEVIPLEYSEVDDFSEGLAATANWQQPSGSSGAGRFGFVDADGREILPFRWDWAFPFEDGLAVVKDGRGLQAYGLIDRTGSLLVPMIWSSANPVGAGRVCVGDEDDRYGLVDRAGNLVVEPSFTRIGEFRDGLATAARGGRQQGWRLVGARFGFIDPAGNEILDFSWDGVRAFHQGLAAVREGGLWGLIDRTGRVVMPPTYEDLRW